MKKGKNFLDGLVKDSQFVRVLRKNRGKRGGILLFPHEGYYFCGDRYVVFLRSDRSDVIDRPIVCEWLGKPKPDEDMIYDIRYLWKSMIRAAKCSPFAKKEPLRPLDIDPELFQACASLVKCERMLVSGPWIVLMDDENENWALLIMRSAGRV